MTDPALVKAVAEEVLETLKPQIDRMERAIMGDGVIGHIGLVERVRLTEATVRGIDDSRLEGDRRLHDRIDHLGNGKASTEDMNLLKIEGSKLARKVDRILWVVAGVGIGSGGLGAWLGSLASG